MMIEMIENPSCKQCLLASVSGLQ